VCLVVLISRFSRMRSTLGASMSATSAGTST
jgi:hypothetical protein